MLNDREKDTLQILLNNDLLMTIIYKIFKQVVEANQPFIAAGDSNALLGEKYRGYELSKQILSLGFRELENYKKVPGSKEQLNKAR